MKRLIKFTIATSAVFFMLSSCKKKTTVAEPETPKKLYLLTQEQNPASSEDMVKYYVDSTAVTLVNGATDRGEAIDMAVSGSDIYVLFSKENITTGNAEYLLYKNGVQLNSFPYTGPFFPLKLVVNGSDIYIAGLGNDPGASYAKARLWKNGTTTNYSDGTREVDVYALTVVNNDVYIGGYQRNAAGVKEATYWKNGTAVVLPSPVSSTDIYDLAISNNDVYAAGASGADKPLYWKNGNLTQLSTNYGVANAIAVSGNDVYIGGELQTASGYQATYWKNGTPVSLTTNSLFASVLDMTVDGSTVYAAGYDAPNLVSGRMCWWKNNTKTVIGPVNGAGEIKRILVK